MKIASLAGLVLLGTHLASAEHYTQPCYQPPAAVVYNAPVVYQAPVVYTAPVVYNAPVYYHGTDPAYNQVVYTPTCPSPNVFIVGRGAYHRSWESSPTVLYIGGGHASHGTLPRRFR